MHIEPIEEDYSIWLRRFASNYVQELVMSHVYETADERVHKWLYDTGSMTLAL